MKICSAPFSTREMQFETTLRFCQHSVIKEATTEAAGDDVALQRGFLHSAAGNWEEGASG